MARLPLIPIMTALLPLVFWANALEAAVERSPLYGADVRSLVIHPRYPDLVYVGTSSGEIYRSGDGGLSWENPRAGAPFPGYTADNLAIDEKGRLWVAAWGLWGGSVVAVSDDGGETWVRRDAGVADHSIRAIAPDPSDADTLLVGGLTGVWRSTDSGRAWEQISTRINVESLAIDPRSSDTIYVGTWRQAWRTDDGGLTWKHIDEGMVLDTDVFAINIDPKDPDDVWVSTCGWVYNSRNRGDLWTRYREGFENRRIHAIERDTTDSNCVYAASVAGLYRTLDRGETWERVSDDRLVINAIGIHPDRPERIILGTEGDGIWISQDRGASWERTSDGLLNVHVGNVVTDRAAPRSVFAVVNHGGTSSGVYRSSDQGGSWERLSETTLPEILSLSVDTETSPSFVAGTELGIWVSIDGREWQRSEPTTLPFRASQVLRYNPTRLFAATSIGTLTSSDGGVSWKRLGDSDEPTVSIAIDRSTGSPSLLALHRRGLHRYTPAGWNPILGAPTGTSISVASIGKEPLALVTTSSGIVSGRIRNERWSDARLEIPPGTRIHTTADAGGRLLFFTSDPQRHLMLAEAGSRFAGTGISLDAREVSSVAVSPADPDRVYIGTASAGIWVVQSDAFALTPLPTGERRVVSATPKEPRDDNFDGSRSRIAVEAVEKNEMDR